jgi:hypothetical protein
MDLSLNTSRVAAAILALGLVIATSACATGGPGPAPTAGPGITGTATSEAVAEGPQPRVGIACDDVLSSATIAATMPGGVVPADMSVAELTARHGSGIPTGIFVRALGGLACEWNNGQPYSSFVGSNPAYLGIRVLVLPDAESQWTRFASYYGDAGTLYCANSLVPLYCSHDELIGTTWVSAEIIGAGSAPAAEAIANEIVAAVNAAGPGGSGWMPPASTLPLSPDCEEILPVTPVGLILGVGVPLVAQGPDGGGWSLGAGARENLGSLGCHYTYEMSMAGVASIEAVPAGAWAWREVRPLITAPETPARAEIGFLGTGDEAWVRCTSDGHECILDLIVGGNWLQLEVWDTDVESESARVTADPRAGILRLGEAVLGELRG